jgi:5'(3')-deoxyribonucleotidase
MRLGIDLDGVVSNFDAAWIEQYKRDFGTTLEADSVPGWNAIPDVTHFRDMEEFWQWARDFGNGSIFRHLAPYPGAIEALATLAEQGHDIVILTTKPDWGVHDTFAWIADWRIPTREVHILEDKWEVTCDVYLDDAPHVLDGFVRHHPDAIVCRFVRPWNHPIDGVVDVEGWHQFLGIVAAAGRDPHAA